MGDNKLIFLALMLILLSIGGVVAGLFMMKTTKYLATKVALTASACFLIGITVMRRLFLPKDPIFIWSEIVWSMLIFVFVFFAINGVLAGKSPK